MSLIKSFADLIPVKYRDVGNKTGVKHLQLNEQQLLDFEIRDLPVPPMVANPHVPDVVDIVEREVNECLDKPWRDQMNMSIFQAYMFTTSDRELFAAIAFVQIFGFFVDDQLDKVRDKAVINHWYKKFKTGQSGGNTPLDRLLVKARRYVDQYLSADQADRHIEYILSYIDTYHTRIDYKNADTGDVMTYDQFLTFRERDCGGVAVFIWAEKSAGFDPNEHNMRDNELYRAFTVTVIKQCVLVNEMFSFRREIGEGDTWYNYMYLIMAREGCTAQTAADRIVAEIHDLQTLAMDYGKRLNELNIPALDRYVQESLNVMNANHYWHTICVRYHGAKQA